MTGQVQLPQSPALHDIALKDRDSPFARYAATNSPADALARDFGIHKEKSNPRTMYIRQAESTRVGPTFVLRNRSPAQAESDYHAEVLQPYSGIATRQDAWHGREAHAASCARLPQYWDSEASRIAARNAMAKQQDQASVNKTSSRRQKSKRILNPFGKKSKPSIRVDTSVSRHHGEPPQQLFQGPLAPSQQLHQASNSGLHLRAKTMRAHTPQRQDRNRAAVMLSTEEPIDRENSGFDHGQKQQEVREVVDRIRETTEVDPATPKILITPANAASGWSLNPEPERGLHQPRVASSVYSRLVLHLPEPHRGAMIPVPSAPAQALRSGQGSHPAPSGDMQGKEATRSVGVANPPSAHADSRDSLVTNFEEETETGRRDRALSGVTIFEEDESPESALLNRTKNVNDLTIETVLPTPRRSRGWWNVITTPFELSHPNVRYMRTPISDGEHTPVLPSRAQEFASTLPWRGYSGADHPSEASPLSSDCETASPTPLMRAFPVDHAPVDYYSCQVQEQILATHDGNEQRLVENAAENPPIRSDAPRCLHEPRAMPLGVERSLPRSAETEVPIVLNVSLEDKALYLQDDTEHAQQGPYATNGQSTTQPGRDVSVPWSGAMLPSDRVVQSSPMIIGLAAVPSQGTTVPPQHVRSSSTDKSVTKPEGRSTPPAYTRDPMHMSTVGIVRDDQTRNGTARSKPSLYGSVREKKRFDDGHSRHRGCFGCTKCFDGGFSHRHRSKRCWFLSCLCLLLFAITALVVALAITLTRRYGQARRDDAPMQSQWFNLTGFPPIPTGVLTIARPAIVKAISGCVQPNTMWSCAVPKEQQQSMALNDSDQPNFKLEIRFDNRSASSTSPAPAPPGLQDQTFLGNTTDNNTAPFEGERTSFYVSFLSSAPLPSRVVKRDTLLNDTNDPFPDLSVLVPPPGVNSDGTAAAANLLPLPSAQHLRLYNRGLPTEHYGFYTYYDRSIFLRSVAPLNDSTVTLGDIPADEDGGSTLEGASVRCTWAQTRFLVQIWTNKAKTAELLPPLGLTSTSTSAPSASATGSASSSSGSAFVRPGTFPYPVTITLDRHGGDVTKKLIYCYGLDDRGRIVPSAKKLQLEDRSFGGVLINPTDGPFGNVTVSIENGGPGGIDGGSGGCQCQWANWQPKT